MASIREATVLRVLQAAEGKPVRASVLCEMVARRTGVPITVENLRVVIHRLRRHGYDVHRETVYMLPTEDKGL